MTFNSILKMNEFDSKIALLENNIKNYLRENKYRIDSKKIKELVQWNHTIRDQKIVRMIYPNEHCPDDLKKIVRGFIRNEFNGFE
ncbi:hypothetical protein ACQY1Q_00500 [Tenacibaculum sp. TC6]|uniref:hypothetical protein n=1 Tax=Tenacibaculum sp. TC6 TaxID=3423223 RepID=UPI003D36E2E3